jgi:hypothetical protein
MRATIESARVGVLAVMLFVLFSGAFWLVGESRADARAVPSVVSDTPQGVQDKKPNMELDTKIFLHRNGIVAAASGCAQRT